MARSARGNVLNSLGRPKDAIPNLVEAIRDLDWLVKIGESQMAYDLAGTYGALATAYMYDGDWDKAVATRVDARDKLQVLVFQRGREQLIQPLARTYLNQKSMLVNRRDVIPFTYSRARGFIRATPLSEGPQSNVSTLKRYPGRSTRKL